MTILSKIVPGSSRQEPLLDEIRNSGKPVIIYGASVYAYVVFQFLKAKGIPVKQFAVDRQYKSADTYMGVEVVAIEDILPEIGDYNVVIGIANYSQVIDRFAAQGITGFHVIDVPDFLNIPNSFMDIEFVKANEDLFNSAFRELEDDLSRDTYIAAINTKINEDVSFIKPFVRPDHLYFTQTEFPLSQHETLLDVGGFNGDSVRDFVKITDGKFNKIISLEPFPQMFADLNATISGLGLNEKCKALQVGAWHEKGTLSFSNTEMEIDSKITDSGDQKIEVDTIDSILARENEKVSLVKMDINGAEYNALRGAAETIRQDRPQIAVKLHVKEDFHRLPLLLREIAPDIKIYVRQRNYMSMMLVLYGVFK